MYGALALDSLLLHGTASGMIARRVCIAFEVPASATFRYFEFTLISGFADQTGQWRRLPQ